MTTGPSPPIHPDRSATLTGRTGTIRVPADYVAQHLELGYAQTSHATQGRTVDTALFLVDSATDSRGIYTPMTRGRDANHAYVPIEDNQTARDVLTQAVARDWIDQPSVARHAQLDPHRSRHLTSIGPNADDELNELERHVRRVIAQRRTRSREAERTTGRSL